MSIFDILGPVMVGPSSSHTAGAVRIGLMARLLLKQRPVYADVGLYGSFAATYHGHGTDRAIAAGLLGMQPDDIRIPSSLQIAEEQGLRIFFSTIDIPGAHPNTAVITLLGEGGSRIVIQASSIGGGRIMINKIDGIDVNFNAETPTLIVHNSDQPGHVAHVTTLLSKNRINIASMQLYRNERGGYAVMVIETDQRIPHDIINEIEKFEGVIKVTYVNGGTEDVV
ncbi:MAG TPA: L-serine ammonia-lyase, iron-sulfur-dependent, subunit beta [Treponema sp.]|nr:L-serine ammonia-lyase, iron-sulfur-dependent, subunit beta [Treponema sp.]